MRVQLLKSSIGDGPALQYGMSYLLNNDVVIDAGCLGFQASLDLQQRVRHLFLTHSHLDHVASLPIWLDNIYRPGVEPPQIYAGVETWQTLSSDLMNDRVWPNLTRIGAEESLFYIPHVLLPYSSVKASHLSVTAIPIDHVISTFAYLVDDGESACAFVSDTGPTQQIWQQAAACPRLKAIFLESSFPSRMNWLAEKSGHLTPTLVAAELAKLNCDVPVYLVHLKPQYHAEILRELAGQQLTPRWHVLAPGEPIQLGNM